MSELSEVLLKLHQGCDVLEKSLGDNLRTIYNVGTGGLRPMNTVTSNLNTLADNIKQAQIALKHCGNHSTGPQEGEETKPKVDILKKYLEKRHCKLEDEVKRQRGVMMYLSDSPAASQETSGRATELDKHQTAKHILEEDTVLGAIGQNATGSLKLAAPMSSVGIMQDSMPKPKQKGERTTDTGGDSLRSNCRKSGVQDTGTHRMDASAFTGQYARDWSMVSSSTLFVWRKSLKQRSDRLSGGISQWIHTTESLIKAEQWQRLSEQPQRAKHLEKRYLRLQTSKARGPPPTARALGLWKKQEEEMQAVHRTMAQKLSEVTVILKEKKEDSNARNRGNAHSQAASGAGHSEDQGSEDANGEKSLASNDSAGSLVNDGQWKQRRKIPSHMIYNLGAAISIWNKDSEEIQTRFKSVPIEESVWRLHRQLDSHDELNDRCLDMDAELAKGLSPTGMSGGESLTVTRLTSARGEMAEHLSALHKIRSRIHDPGESSASGQGHSGAVKIDLTEAQASAYSQD